MRIGGRCVRTLLVLTGMLALIGSAGAQTVRIQPSVDTHLTYTDNIAAGDSASKRSDWIAEVAPGIGISRASGRFSGDLHARFRALAHARETDRNATFVVLGGAGTIEAVEQLLFIDLDASISRNNRSGLTGRRGDDFLNVDRANQTRQYSIGPRLTFNLFGDARGDISYRSTWFDGGGDIDGRRTDAWRGALADPAGFGRWGWGLNATRSTTTFDDAQTRRATQESARATLFVNISQQLRLRGNVGRESNDFSVGASERSTIKGVGVDWYPTERTSLSGTVEDRFFGTGYNLAIDHRRALSAWNLSMSRDVSSSLDTRTVPFTELDFEQIASITDPDERERQLALLNQLGPRFDFVTNNFFVARILRASVSLIGARNVLTFTLQRAERARLGTPVTNDPRDDFATFDETTDDAASVSLTHRLSGITSLNSSLTHSRSEGTGLLATRAKTDRSAFSLGLTTRFGPKATGGLQYRYQRAEGATDFTENLITASIGVRF